MNTRTSVAHGQPIDAAAPVETITVPVQMLPHGEGLEPPSYMTLEASGMDIRAAVDAPVTLPPGGRALIPTGFAIALPCGWEAQIRPRSGLALKKGITVLNSPGTIDADYRGEVGVALVNLSQTPFQVTRGMRIAQMVVAPVYRCQWVKTDHLPDTARGEGGFGHTGR